jgi:hypothetical protein
MPESANPGSEWVVVYSKATGRKQTVPASWPDHKRLGSNIRKTPLTKSRETTTNTAAAADKE